MKDKTFKKTPGHQHQKLTLLWSLLQFHIRRLKFAGKKAEKQHLNLLTCILMKLKLQEVKKRKANVYKKKEREIKRAVRQL